MQKVNFLKKTTLIGLASIDAGSLDLGHAHTECVGF